MKKAILVLAIMAGCTTATWSKSSTVDAAIGGAVGGAAGAAIGNEVGGREGAIAGSALGAAVGTAINTGGEIRPRSTYSESHQQTREPRHGHPHYRFCPPGQAKKGRC